MRERESIIQKMVLDANKMLTGTLDRAEGIQVSMALLTQCKINWSNMNFVQQRVYMVLLYLKNQGHKFNFNDLLYKIVYCNVPTLGLRAYVIHFDRYPAMIVSQSDDYCYLNVTGKQFKIQPGYKEFVNHYILNLRTALETKKAPAPFDITSNLL